MTIILECVCVKDMHIIVMQLPDTDAGDDAVRKKAA